MTSTTPERSISDPWPADTTPGIDIRSLADVPVDTTPELPAPKDFDMESFIAGVRPTRRSVQLYPKADLVARLEQIAMLIDQAADDDNVDALVDEFEQVRDQFRDGVWFTVEKRSAEWVERFRLDVEKELGLKRSRDEDGDEVLSNRDATTVSMYQLAAQIVVPERVTYEQLARLRETNEGECTKLMAAMLDVNNLLAQKAGVLTRDFSGRRSTRSAT